MMKLRINPLVVKDLKEIRDFIADDNPDKAAETIDNIYKTFENVQQFKILQEFLISGKLSELKSLRQKEVLLC